MTSLSQSSWKRLSRKLEKVSVIIIGFNTAELIRQCLDAVLESKDVELEIFIIDNASTDRTPMQLARRYHLRKNSELFDKLEKKAKDKEVVGQFVSLPEDSKQVAIIRSGESGRHTIHLIENKTNLGFGRANNLALSLSTADYFLFLNSDAFVSPHAMEKLVKATKTKETKPSSVLRLAQKSFDNVGIVAAQLFNSDGTLQIQGGNLPSLQNIFTWITFLDDLPFVSFFSSYQHHQGQMASLLRQKRARVGWVGGTAMMMTRSCLEEIGGFDPMIFMYGEDVEICWRATKRHWDVVLVDADKVTHLGSASGSSHRAMVGEIGGLVYLWHKHGSKSELWLLRHILKFGIRFRILVFGILRRYGRQRTYQEALALV